jgi:hypothetical protein
MQTLSVMPGLAPGIHVFHRLKTWMASKVGLARLSREIISRKSGTPDLR